MLLARSGYPNLASKSARSVPHWPARPRQPRLVLAPIRIIRIDAHWISNDWVVQYQGRFLQLKPQNKRYGPTRAKALICEWEDGAVEVRYRGAGIAHEDLAVRPPVVTAAVGEPRREPARPARNKPTQDHPWRQGYEQRMKLQGLKRSQGSSPVGASASASP
jgi:hypothetical protein